MSLLLSRHHTEKISEDRLHLIQNIHEPSPSAANVIIEYTDLPKEKEVTVIGLSQDKKFLTVGGRREHRVLQIERDAN
jgi:hypothetical protein